MNSPVLFASFFFFFEQDTRRYQNYTAKESSWPGRAQTPAEAWNILLILHFHPRKGGRRNWWYSGAKDSRQVGNQMLRYLVSIQIRIRTGSPSCRIRGLPIEQHWKQNDNCRPPVADAGEDQTSKNEVKQALLLISSPGHAMWVQWAHALKCLLQILQHSQGSCQEENLIHGLLIDSFPYYWLGDDIDFIML